MKMTEDEKKKKKAEMKGKWDDAKKGAMEMAKEAMPMMMDKKMK